MNKTEARFKMLDFVIDTFTYNERSINPITNLSQYRTVINNKPCYCSVGLFMYQSFFDRYPHYNSYDIKTLYQTEKQIVKYFNLNFTNGYIPDIEFLVDLQELHDNNEYWSQSNLNSLTCAGLDFVQKIKNRIKYRQYKANKNLK